jgi:hypothetical protein
MVAKVLFEMDEAKGNNNRKMVLTDHGWLFNRNNGLFPVCCPHIQEDKRPRGSCSERARMVNKTMVKLHL